MRRLAVIALAITTCVGPQAPKVTATPVVTPPIAITTASPTPTPTSAPQRLGVAYALPDSLTGLGLRLESDPQPFATLAGSLYPVVSPDGRRLAFWHRENDVVETRDTLRAIELLTGEEIELARLDNELAGGIAWRSDGAAVVFSATSPGLADPGSTLWPRPSYTALRTVEVGGRQIREVRRLEKTRIFPVAWSSSAHVIVGLDAPEGVLLTLFRVREDGSSAGDTVGEQRFQEIVDVTHDAQEVLAQFAYAQAGRLYSGIRVVGAESPRPIAERLLLDGSIVIRARFQPGTNDVVVLMSVGDSGRYALEVWPSGASTARRIWTSAAAATRNGDLVMRVDGKAAYVLTFGPSGGSWQTIELDTGVAAPFVIGTSSGPIGPWIFSESFLITDAAIAKLRR